MDTKTETRPIIDWDILAKKLGEEYAVHFPSIQTTLTRILQALPPHTQVLCILEMQAQARRVMGTFRLKNSTDFELIFKLTFSESLIATFRTDLEVRHILTKLQDVMSSHIAPAASKVPPGNNAKKLRLEIEKVRTGMQNGGITDRLDAAVVCLWILTNNRSSSTLKLYETDKISVLLAEAIPSLFATSDDARKTIEEEVHLLQSRKLDSRKPGISLSLTGREYVRKKYPNL